MKGYGFLSRMPAVHAMVLPLEPTADFMHCLSALTGTHESTLAPCVLVSTWVVS